MSKFLGTGSICGRFHALILFEVDGNRVVGGQACTLIMASERDLSLHVNSIPCTIGRTDSIESGPHAGTMHEVIQHGRVTLLAVMVNIRLRPAWGREVVPILQSDHQLQFVFIKPDTYADPWFAVLEALSHDPYTWFPFTSCPLGSAPQSARVPSFPLPVASSVPSSSHRQPPSGVE